MRAINNIPTAVAPTAVRVSVTFVSNIITKEPNNMVPDEIKFCTLMFNARPIVSTSFVTLDNVSPTVVWLKNDIGKRLILIEISLRKFSEILCVIVAIIHPWIKVNSPPNPNKARIDNPIVVTLSIFNEEPIPSWITLVNSPIRSGASTFKIFPPAERKMAKTRASQYLLLCLIWR